MSESVPHTVLRRQVASALAGVAAMFLSSSTPDAAVKPQPAITGRAIVIDGDTLDIGGQRVRLEGIDAPETSQTCGRAWVGWWSCGKTASKALGSLIGDRRVDCQSQGRDKYGRILGICTVGGDELNAAMVRTGMAWAFVKYSTAYIALEAQAKAAKAGVWQGEAEAPWLYRQARWQTAEQVAPDGCAIKGNVTGQGHIYHMPWSPWYGKVKVEAAKGERWFCSETEAQKAGWRGVY
ncbi:MAG: thermonuclease family protein [Hyphomicrobium sp.]